MALVINPPRTPDSDGDSWLPQPAQCVLDNGLRVFLAERRESPIVEMRFVLDQGFAAEARKRSGLAGLAMAMFSEGALRVGSARLDTLQESLGAAFAGRVLADGAIVGVSALALSAPDVLAICARLLANPDFDADGFDRIRVNRLALIARERRNSLQLALRVLPAALYGDGHPYARPFSGSGSAPSVAALAADDLCEYYETNLAPERVTLVMAGPLALAEAKPLLERTLGRWNASASALPAHTADLTHESPKPGSKVAASSSPVAATADQPTVTIVDQPNMEQAAMVMGVPTVARNSSVAEALMVADAIIAGTFASRLNLKLREERGWTYGVRSSLIDARLQGLWLISAFVRQDRAVAAMAEIADEVDNLAGGRPCSPGELRRAVDYLVARTPSSYETCAQIADMLAGDFIYRLPSGYRRGLSARLRCLDCDGVTEACKQIRAASAPHWVIVADAGDLADRLRKAGFTEINTFDASGPPP
jgi:zinc protease